jgi:predicted nucleic acid-binding protein
VKILFDTSVLVAALVESHPVHINAVAALRRVQNAQDMGWIAMHSIAELYSVLTRLPIQPRGLSQRV